MSFNETPVPRYKENVMPYATKVTTDNVDYIIDWMKSEHNLNVEHIKDELEYDAHFGEFYAITDGSMLENNSTFTTMGNDDFHSYWYFPHGEDINLRIIDKKL